jgi:hypothetical protein
MRKQKLPVSEWTPVNLETVPGEALDLLKRCQDATMSLIIKFAVATKQNLGEKSPSRLFELGRAKIGSKVYFVGMTFWSNRVTGGNVQLYVDSSDNNDIDINTDETCLSDLQRILEQ